MVNQDRLRLFTAALRSDNYAQGVGTLTTITPDGNEEHCCLGVACLVAIANGVEVEVVRYRQSVTYDNASAVLPGAILDWYGFDDGNPLLNVNQGGYAQAAATIVNDQIGLPFRIIADLFEDTYMTD